MSPFDGALGDIRWFYWCPSTGLRVTSNNIFTVSPVEPHAELLPELSIFFFFSLFYITNWLSIKMWEAGAQFASHGFPKLRKNFPLLRSLRACEK